MTMTKVPARPSAVVPPRPQQAKPAVTAAAPVAAAPVAAAPVAAAATNETTAAPVVAAAPAAVDGATATATAPKKRGRKKGDGTSAAKKEKTDYHGLFVWEGEGENQKVVMVDDGTNSGVLIPQRKKLDAIPTDFNPKQNNKLRANDFSDEALFCEFNAALYQKIADSWTKKGKKIRALGSATDKKKALKYIKMREQLQALREQLAAQGGDLASLDLDDSDNAAE
jgi:hypothetical protein